MMLRGSQRSFHSAAVCLGRKSAKTKKPVGPPKFKPTGPALTIKAPIPPAAKNIKVKDDHPLWQFFSQKKYWRKFSELDQTGRPWTIPELRRKSFNDLHSLWYNCLKERNVLAREQHLLNTENEQPDSPYMRLSDEIRETMWRIRHVLSERHHAYDRSQELLPQYKAQILEEFKENYLTAPKEEEEDLKDSLKRLQYAVFGITEVIQHNIVDKHFVEGLKFIANLKLERYAKEHADFNEIYPVSDAGEAFLLFYCETNEINENIESIKSLRKDNVRVERINEIETVTRFVDNLIKENE